MWIKIKCYKETAAKIGHNLMFIERNRELFLALGFDILLNAMSLSD